MGDSTGAARIVPVILSGGAGTRLWPMSRPERPKQFLPLAGTDSLFRQTLERTDDAMQFAPPVIVANARHRALIEADLAGSEALLLLEPAARNTAPAIALAAVALPDDAPMLVMPSDHVIADVAAFHAAIAAGLPLARDGWLVTFGITPTGPETGYGYIRFGEKLSESAHAVSRFIEKPDAARAQAMIDEGGHAWNGGIFLFTAGAYRAALSAHVPAMLAAAVAAMDAAKRDGAALLPDADAFAASPSDSIDYAVMERAERVAVVPVAMGWSDIGSWDSLYDFRAKDAAGNAAPGAATLIDTRGCLIEADGVEVAMLGVSDLIVIATEGRLLIMPRGSSQRVREVVDVITAADRAA